MASVPKLHFLKEEQEEEKDEEEVKEVYCEVNTNKGSVLVKIKVISHIIAGIGFGYLLLLHLKYDCGTLSLGSG